jgi:hypothetical protein
MQACYTVKFKMGFVRFAQEHRNKARRKFDIYETNIRQLSEEKEK